MAEEEKKETTEKKEETENIKDDAAALLEQLGELGITDSEKLQNVVHASSQTGKAWNEVGALRKQVEQLTEDLAKAQQRPTEDYYSGTETVDLSNMIESGVRKVFSDIQKQNYEQQQKTAEDIQSIQTDPDFRAVEGIWTKYLNSNPGVSFAIQSGQTTYRDEYNKVVRQYYRTIAERSKNVIEGLTQNNQVEPPHVEQGQEQHLEPEKARDKIDMKKIDESRASGRLGSNDALQDIINQTLPADDPIFRF